MVKMYRLAVYGSYLVTWVFAAIVVENAETCNIIYIYVYIDRYS